MASSSCCHLAAPTAATFFHPPSKVPTSLRPPAQRPLSSSHCICPSSALLFCAPRVGAAGIVAEQKKYPPKIVEEDPSWVDDGSGRPPVPAAKEGGGLFGWVTNNKSSREAIQLENTPAQVRGSAGWGAVSLLLLLRNMRERFKIEPHSLL